ncbi:hypothetical protein [Pseudomonas sp. RGM 3321]|uniref:hypothetical protein n=1 Tax=Pseudomonas sp. RGM 3321 TaxID=2930089 RepID=UPI001FCB110D|nr:hypothetical protein [Pseudomonas sp. RGM 3321]MCJ2373395.1 hypothetical protein [Pseudomonas sp. RGM 3321]
MRFVAIASLVAVSLFGCSGIPSAPYVEPAQSENSARLRVITNSNAFGDTIVGNCRPASRHKMAEAGRFTSEGRPSLNTPQYPLEPAILGMPKRAAPELIQYMGIRQMAEGFYKEVVTEYRVRTDAPFQIATSGAGVGNFGSTYSSCPEQALVFKLEPGKDYEALVGVGGAPDKNGVQSLMCIMGVIELVSLPGTEVLVPRRVMPITASQDVCKG